MIVLIFLLIIFIIVLALPVGIDASLHNAAPCINAKISFKKFKLFPLERKEKKAEKKPKEKTNNKRQISFTQKLNFGIEEWLEVIETVFKLMAKFKKSIVFDKIRFVYTVTAPDPYDAVIKYNLVNLAAGSFAPFMENNFKIKDFNVNINLDLDDQRGNIDIHIILTVRIVQLFVLGFTAAFLLLKTYLKCKAKAAKERKMLNGKQQAQ